jgi:hypothetical protein
MLNRLVIADHYFCRYFDLGLFVDIHLRATPYIDSDLRLYDFWRLWMSRTTTLHISSHECVTGSMRAYEFSCVAPAFALEILSSSDDDFNIIVSDLEYQMCGSRYDVHPRTLSNRAPREVTIMPCSADIASKCYEAALPLYLNRNPYSSKTKAFEALRRGKKALANKQLLMDDEC